ncbi:DUF6153 family protein [Isoptericola cucumis]
MLLLAVLLVGVVAMHAMGGSSTHHGGPAAVVGHEAPAPAVHKGADVAPDTTGDATGDAGHGTTTDGVGHEAATAMCLMVLVGLLALVVPGRAVLVVLRPGRHLTGLAGPPVRGATPPDLHALGISRT